MAQKFLEAAVKFMRVNPAALQLRAMNIIYETIKERGATILIPDCHGRRHESRRNHGSRSRREKLSCCWRRAQAA